MKWNFAEHNEHLDNVGFKDNDIEKFGQDPAKSIVREAIQNSCDAIDIEKHQTTVKVVINSGRISKDALPDFSEIEEHIIKCVHPDNDPAENEEVQRHIDAFEDDAYTYLEIADYNTTGMDLKPFEGLTQGIFKSVKKISGSQGSKGVGKAAYYASSYLRTMLIVTKSNDGLRYRGAAKLANHSCPLIANKKLNYKGFYGDLSLKNINDVPTIFQRTEKGTSIFVIGLWEIEHLKETIIREVLRNYWFAIYKDQLILEVLGSEISSVNIQQLMNDYFEDNRDYLSGEKQNPRPYLETIINGKEYQKEIANIGNCSLWLHQNDEYNLGAVARFRKTKMLIYKKKNLDSGFSGVFLCDNEEGNSFLKEIENDAHDTWNANINQSYKTRAKETLTEIKEFISESYFNFSGINDKTTFQLDAIDELFNFSGGNTTRQTKKTEHRPKPEPTEKTKDRIIDKAKFSAYYENDNLYYRLIIQSHNSKNNQRFKVSVGTDSSKDHINILDCSDGSFEGNVLTLNIERGENIIEKIKLDAPYIVAPSITSISN